jgi:hypothetical protein
VFRAKVFLQAGLLLTAMSYGQSQPDYYTATSLQEAKQREARRHWAAETEIQKRLIDAETDLANDKIACKADVKCIDKANTKFQDKRDQIAKERNNEEGTHRKNDLDIERHFGSPRIN